MMASNLLSRLLPSTSDEGQPPEPRQSHPSDPYSDVENDADMAIDERNLGQPFQEQDLEQLLAEATGSEMATESTAFLQQGATESSRRGKLPARSQWAKESPAPLAPIEDDDDVPESLLLEGNKNTKGSKRARTRRRAPPNPYEIPAPIAGASTQATRAQWEATKAQQRLHKDTTTLPLRRPIVRQNVGGAVVGDPKELARWKWANVENLDKFLKEVYDYYELHGVWSILLYRALRLLYEKHSLLLDVTRLTYFSSILFVLSFVTFLMFCVDYRLLPKSSKLEDVLVPKCTQQ